MAKLSGLSVEQLEEYRDGGWLYGLKVQNPGGCRSLCRWKPCTWTTRRKAGAGWTKHNADGLAEIAAAQGVKL